MFLNTVGIVYQQLFIKKYLQVKNTLQGEKGGMEFIKEIFLTRVLTSIILTILLNKISHSLKKEQYNW